jgi:hypothetical protein
MPKRPVIVPNNTNKKAVRSKMPTKRIINFVDKTGKQKKYGRIRARGIWEVWARKGWITAIIYMNSLLSRWEELVNPPYHPFLKSETVNKKSRVDA